MTREEQNDFFAAPALGRPVPQPPPRTAGVPAAAQPAAPEAREPRTASEWRKAIDAELAQPEPRPLAVAGRAVERYPTESAFLEMAALGALVERKPDLALLYLKRLHKWYLPNDTSSIYHAIALAQSGKWPVAQNALAAQSVIPFGLRLLFPPRLVRWGSEWCRLIATWQPRGSEARPPPARRPAAATGRREARAAAPPAEPAGTGEPVPAAPALPRVAPRIAVATELAQDSLAAWPRGAPAGATADFLLYHDLCRVSLLKGFDELLCLGHLRGVDHYWYQVETARKVLRQFRGRALLADEVGLGKTIEAGLALKEYLLRGMAERVLILTPPSLVTQWQEEMAAKFDAEFLTTHDPLLRRDSAAFWASPRIIASIAVARLPQHAEAILRHPIDLVVVDEAHHLKNRRSRNWQFVDGLQKRFLLLLTATPVENNLVELYNLLTLLKPGLFKTEQEFRASYVKPGDPRRPLNRERLRDLMRDVMVRNTRALVDVRLPPRHALTVRVAPLDAERACYEELAAQVRTFRHLPGPDHRLALHHLLEAAGSCPAAAVQALDHFLRQPRPPAWAALRERYAALSGSSKLAALTELLGRNPTEKSIVFVRHRATLEWLARHLAAQGCALSTFDGALSGPQKDRAIEAFRDRDTVLLCTECGGEGRNLQFCNTLVNFDLPWNPQEIEQRIGRLHRIGQPREVFVFNFAVRHTIEERVLQILGEKINMFELVVGEIQAILGEMEDTQGFAERVFAAWMEETDATRAQAFDRLGDDLVAARRQYDGVKAYDEELFADDFEAL